MTGNRRKIKCMYCNNLFHSSKDTPWTVNRVYVRLLGIEVDTSAVREAEAARTSIMQNVLTPRSNLRSPSTSVESSSSSRESLLSNHNTHQMHKRPKNVSLVWARETDDERATEHAAYLLDADIDNNSALVEWASNGLVTKIPKNQISLGLAPRHRNHPDYRDTLVRKTPKPKPRSRKISRRSDIVSCHAKNMKKVSSLIEHLLRQDVNAK